MTTLTALWFWALDLPALELVERTLKCPATPETLHIAALLKAFETQAQDARLAQDAELAGARRSILDDEFRLRRLQLRQLEREERERQQQQEQQRQPKQQEQRANQQTNKGGHPFHPHQAEIDEEIKRRLAAKQGYNLASDMYAWAEGRRKGRDKRDWPARQQETLRQDIRRIRREM